mgnify:FL=1
MTTVKNSGLSKNVTLSARRGLYLLMLATCLGAAACSGDKADGGDAGADAGATGPVPSVPFEPQFPPDNNNLTPRPGVEAATEAEQNHAIVKPDSLEFSVDQAPSVRSWQPGRIVASGSAGPENPFGYARRVVSVKEANGMVVVETEPVGLRDLVAGDLNVRLDTMEGTEVDMSNVDLEWVAKNL